MVSLGQRLKEQRLKKRLTLEEVASATKIRQSFLSAIENGEYQKLPSPAYAEGFVGNYAQYIGLPKSQTIALLRREFDAKKNFAVLPESFSEKKEFKIKRINTGQLFFLLFGAVIIVGYLVFQYRSAFTNPPLEISSPSENAVITGSFVKVLGKTSPDSSVFVDNAAVQVSQDGSFSKSFSVFPGEMVIVVKARSRIGKETQINRHIVVEE